MADEQNATLTAPVFSQQRAEVGTIELPTAVFTEPLRHALLAAVVRMQTANRRAGSIRSPLWPGGGTIFGPHPRDYGYDMPKRARKAALRSVLAQKLREERLVILDRLELAEPKTKLFAAMLRDLGIDDTVLVVIAGADERVERAGRNLPRVKVLRAAGLNVYDVLRYHHLVVTRDALAAISARVAA